MFTCGAGNFAHVDHEGPPPPPPSPPPKGKRHHSKNPYATRGLDKFSMVLAELETRREKIIAKAGAQGVEIIQFACDNSQDWVPIVVRPREGKGVPQPPTEEASEEAVKIKDEKKKKEEEVAVVLKKPLVGLKLRWRYECYWHAVVVLMLILVCLVMFGRVFAICCTSICWYAMPAIKERIVVKKETKRRPSDKRLGKNLVVQSHGKKNVQELASPKAHGNGKKG